MWRSIPPGAVVFSALCIAPIFGSVSLDFWDGHGSVTICREQIADSESSAAGDYALLWIEKTFYGSPNGTLASWILLFAYYFAGYHYGMSFFRKQRMWVTRLAQRGRAHVPVVRTTAALAAVGLAWLREVVDTPVLPAEERLYQP